MNKFKFGLRGHDIADNFNDMCSLAKENGIDILQFALAKSCSDIDFDAVGYNEKLSSDIKKKLLINQLKVAVLGCYINPVALDEKSRNIQIERFKNFIYYAKDFDADVIGTETGNVNTLQETHSEENYLNFLKNMIPLVEKAEELGVKIGIEPVWIYTIYSVEMMRRMLDDIKSENIEVILDVSNMITAENHPAQKYMIQNAFELLGDKITTIHLKDYNIANGRRIFAPTGTGLLDIGLIFDNIKSMKKKPQIILDELPLLLYDETVERINNLLK